MYWVMYMHGEREHRLILLHEYISCIVYEYHESYLIVIATLATTMRMVQDNDTHMQWSTKSADETAGSLLTAGN